MSKFKNLVVKDVKKETSSAVSIAFDVPEEIINDFKFIAGQYITVRTNIDNKEIRRSYSICSSPESNELRVAVKELENGILKMKITRKQAGFFKKC